MEKSETIKEITAALLKFHKTVKKIKKESDNPFFKSKYASLANILDIIAEPLNESELVIMQFPENNENQLELITILQHSSGEYFKTSNKMEVLRKPNKQFEKFDQFGKGIGEQIIKSMDIDPQAIGSLITYLRRYAIGSILNLNIDEDDDANSASGNKVEDKPKKQAQQQTTQQSTSNNNDDLPWLNAPKEGTTTEDWTKTLDYLKKSKSENKEFETAISSLRKKFKIANPIKDKLLTYFNTI